MNKIILKGNKFFCIILILNYFSIANLEYRKIDLKLIKGQDSSLPLYIETNDVCGKWVPALFSSLSLINRDIEGNYSKIGWEIKINSPIVIISEFSSVFASLWLGQVSVFDQVYVAKANIKFPEYCQFGFGYSDVIPEDRSEKYNLMKFLVSSKQIEKNIFSFGKWELNDTEFIHSTLYIGDSHENFLEDNVGSCKIENGSGYFGCIFDDFIFLNETYSLKDENNKQIVIYFSSELSKIYFPQDFFKIPETCNYGSVVNEFTCEDLIQKDYLTLKLRSENMNITLEVDNLKRYYTANKENLANIAFHQDIDYIIFPLTMFKNFHVQFDVENNTISFYSNDTFRSSKKRKAYSNRSPTASRSKRNVRWPLCRTRCFSSYFRYFVSRRIRLWRILILEEKT